MKHSFGALRVIVGLIAILVFLAGVVLTFLGVYDFAKSFSHLYSTDEKHLAGSIAIGLLSAIDLFLIAIVFLVFSIGLIMLFANPDATPSLKLPGWLQIKSFMQLKVILWEAILTTLVIAYLTGLAEKKINNIDITPNNLIVPSGILLIALSLYFLKRGEKKEE